ncbi:docking protein 2 [Ambystoma mexicanum]|uniref:docking protein 2 n=1 Tax=Ambystoma mexicanum TaxID=8296 RepID=UPI0037E79790
MDEGPVRQGLLHVQHQQTFGKKWKRVWALLYGKSACAIARLELVEGANPPEKTKKSENKKVIKLSDCIRVSEANAEGSPRGTSAFLLETTERMYLLAADNAEQEAWISQLCELAFQMGKEPPVTGKDTQQRTSNAHLPSMCVTMEDNALYSMSGTGSRTFQVTVRSTEASDRCHLRGAYTLKAQKDALDLWHRESGETLYSWPYLFLRRFGRDKVMFSFEAGRRCASGEGNFEFETRQGSEIFLAIESAISLQKSGAQLEPSGVVSSQGAYSRVGGGGQNDTYRCVVSKGPLRVDLKSDDPIVESDRGEPSGKTHPIGSRCLSLGPEREAKILLQNSQCSKTLMPSRKKGGHPPGTLYSEPSVVSHAQQPSGSRSQDKPSHKQVESEYAVPFDTIAKSLMTSGFGGFLQANPNPGWPSDILPDSPDPGPLYNSIEEVSAMKAKQRVPPPHVSLEHIYDEPEGRSSLVVYDEPQEMKGEAWKLQALETDPTGHEYPYNPVLDDYSVPKKQVGGSCTRGVSRQAVSDKDWLEESEYDNVVLMKPTK